MRDSVSVRALVVITAGSSDNQSRVAAIVTGEAARPLDDLRFVAPPAN